MAAPSPTPEKRSALDEKENPPSTQAEPGPDGVSQAVRTTCLENSSTCPDGSDGGKVAWMMIAGW
ncbi:hypothetical protein PM082_008141 [Marasmius tenuissimus]|nr:hypothetical protein PM082_008141 [Marasmius tenuissimus]